TPCSTHAEALRALIAGCPRLFHHFLQFGQTLIVRKLRVMVLGLGAVSAVLCTCPRLNRHQRRELNLVWRVVRPVHFLSTVNQVEKRHFVEPKNSSYGPEASFTLYRHRFHKTPP